VADDVFQPKAQVELLLESLVFEHEGLLPHGFFTDDADFIIDDGLGQIIKSAQLDRLDRAFDRSKAGDDDHDNMRMATADGAKELAGLRPGMLMSARSSSICDPSRMPLAASGSSLVRTS
jgi:hypothetical protein